MGRNEFVLTKNIPENSPTLASRYLGYIGLTHKGFGFGGVFTDNDNDQDLFVNQYFGYKAIPYFLFNNHYPQNKLDGQSSYTMMIKS